MNCERAEADACEVYIEADGSYASVRAHKTLTLTASRWSFALAAEQPSVALQTLCFDYGFRTGTGRLYQEGYGETPKSAFSLVG